MLPTLALISDGKVVDYVVGFDDLGGSDDFPTEHLRCLLANKSMLTYEVGRYKFSSSSDCLRIMYPVLSRFT
jgi:hypothetical protein